MVQEPHKAAGNAVINADGSAEFAGGEVTIFSSGSLRTNGQIYVSDKTTLSSDGSATFAGLTEHAGGVKVTGGDIAIGNPVTGRIVSAGGGISIKNNVNTGFTLGYESAGGSYITAGSIISPKAFRVGHQITPNTTNATNGETYCFVANNPVEATGGKTYMGFKCQIDGNESTSSDLNVGFYSNVQASNAGAPTYNFYAEGDAPNYFAGPLLLGSSVLPRDQMPFDIKSPIQGYAIQASATDPKLAPVSIGVGGGSNKSRTYLAAWAITNTSPLQHTNTDSIISDSSGRLSFKGTSDYRTKTNITPLPSATSIIENLNPVSFEFIWSPGFTASGFVAHEVQEHFPEAVTGTKDQTIPIGTLADYDGTVLETEVTEPDELEYTEEVETDGVSTMVTRARTWTANRNPSCLSRR